MSDGDAWPLCPAGCGRHHQAGDPAPLHDPQCLGEQLVNSLKILAASTDRNIALNTENKRLAFRLAEARSLISVLASMPLPPGRAEWEEWEGFRAALKRFLDEDRPDVAD